MFKNLFQEGKKLFSLEPIEILLEEKQNQYYIDSESPAFPTAVDPDSYRDGIRTIGFR